MMMQRLLGCAAVAVLLMACGKKSADSKNESKDVEESKSAEPFVKLPGFDVQATHAGKPAEFKTAIAFQRPGKSGIELYLSTHKRDCDIAKKNGIPMSDGELLVGLTVVDSLTPEGKTAWKLFSSYFGGNTQMGRNEIVTVENPEGGPTKVVLPKLALESAGKKVESLELSGTLVAKACGVIPDPSASKAPPAERQQPDLTVTVAGQKQAVLGALYREANKSLVLSTMAMTCEEGAYSDSDVAVIVSDEGGTVNLQGRRIGMQYSSNADPKLTMKVGSPSGGAVDVTLEGSSKLGGFPVELKGKANALVCPR
jgi:hypothetical protein